MVEALKSVEREVPKYLEALAGKSVATSPDEVAFAMFCFWTGKRKLGVIDGVLTTEAGWIGGHEVTYVVYDRARLSFGSLVERAASVDCVKQVYVTSPDDQNVTEKSRLKVGPLVDYRPAKLSDQKKQISGISLQKLKLSEAQATKLNALARTDPHAALQWLSPRQRVNITKS